MDNKSQILALPHLGAETLGKAPVGAFPFLQGQVGSGSCLLLFELMFGSRPQDDKHRLYYAPVFFCGPLK